MKKSRIIKRNRKRQTKRGGWPWSTSSPPKENSFADEIIANLDNGNYSFTGKINNMSSYDLQKVTDKLYEKSKSVDENTRKRIDARIRQINAKIADLIRSIGSIHDRV